MTSPKDRAERIVAEIYNRFNKCRTKRHLNLIPLIQREIEEAVKEESRKMQEISELRIAQAKREAFLESAEIADDHNGCVDRECLSKSNCGATIANKIRKKAEEL